MLNFTDAQFQRVARSGVEGFPARIAAHWAATRPGFVAQLTPEALMRLVEAVLQDGAPSPHATEADLVLAADLRLHALLQQRREAA